MINLEAVQSTREDYFRSDSEVVGPPETEAEWLRYYTQTKFDCLGLMCTSQSNEKKNTFSLFCASGLPELNIFVAAYPDGDYPEEAWHKHFVNRLQMIAVLKLAQLAGRQDVDFLRTVVNYELTLKLPNHLHRVEALTEKIVGEIGHDVYNVATDFMLSFTHAESKLEIPIYKPETFMSRTELVETLSRIVGPDSPFFNHDGTTWVKTSLAYSVRDFTLDSEVTERKRQQGNFSAMSGVENIYFRIRRMTLAEIEEYVNKYWNKKTGMDNFKMNGAIRWEDELFQRIIIEFSDSNRAALLNQVLGARGAPIVEALLQLHDMKKEATATGAAGTLTPAVHKAAQDAEIPEPKGRFWEIFFNPDTEEEFLPLYLLIARIVTQR